MSVNNSILVRKIKKGNAEAFRQLFDAYRNVLFAYAFKFTRSRELSEETVQEVFLKLWQRREALDPERSVQAYLYRIARNHVFNLLKRAVYDERLKEYIFYRRGEYEASAEEQLILSEIQEIKEHAISALPPRRQLIFRMSRMEGLSHQEIAKKLGISKNTVKDQIVKASNAIQDHLHVHAGIAIPLLILMLRQA